MTKTRIFSTRLYDEQIDFVESECKRQRLSASKVIRNIVADENDRRKRETTKR